MTKDEALKMAIDYLEHQYEIGAWGQDLEGLIDCCKEALEHPTQRNFCERCGKRASKDLHHIHTCTPLQALEQPAPSWQGLSDDEIVIICAKMAAKLPNKKIDLIFAYAIEQALKEKNT